MNLRRIVLLGAAAVAVITALYAQRPFRVYPAAEGYENLQLPPDYNVPGELILGRLMYPSASRGRGGMGGGDWTQGRTNWTIDYPKGDRTFAVALRRLTRIHVRSVEQPVNPDDAEDIFNWPYLHVSMPGSWNLTESQAARIREHLLRGAVMMCDSFFGTDEWTSFERGMKLIFPDREIEELPNEDAIFHTVYNLNERIQVGNFRSMSSSGEHAYRSDGSVPHWRGIRDDKGRIMVFMTFNNDLGDSWQLADEPRYPAKFSDMGIRMGINWVTYALTH
jgi:hypothetical protein